MESFESINQLNLPPEVERRMRELMHRRSEGRLSTSEHRELDLIIEARQALDGIRAKANPLLASTPRPQIQPVAIHHPYFFFAKR